MAATVFFVTALTEAPKVRARLHSLIPADDRYELADDKWMVAHDGTARELAESLGIRGGDEMIGNGLALPVTMYSGRAPSGLWEWLAKKA
jgi:hypothetical protein